MSRKEAPRPGLVRAALAGQISNRPSLYHDLMALGKQKEDIRRLAISSVWKA